MASRRKNFNGTLHRHGCKRCHLRYEDACDTSEVDGLCPGCRGLRPWQYLIDNMAARPCCVENSRIVTRDDINAYRLGGTHIWHICKTCSRTHPTKPRLPEENP